MIHSYEEEGGAKDKKTTRSAIPKIIAGFLLEYLALYFNELKKLLDLKLKLCEGILISFSFFENLRFN